MHLAKIEAANFRTFEEFAITFEPGLRVLIGENNIGKTNLFDAVRIALGPASTSSSVPRLQASDRHRESSVLRRSDVTRIDLQYAGLTDDEQAAFVECLDPNLTDPAASTASIHFEWTWSASAGRGVSRRWGGDRVSSEAPVPEEVLQSIQVVVLDALRDPAQALGPGRRSRIARLIVALADEDEQRQLVEIMARANDELAAGAVVSKVTSRLDRILAHATGTLSQRTAVRATDSDFDGIAQSLKILYGESPTVGTAMTFLAELSENGLGYNNLIYIATVLAELEAARGAVAPLLLVEEPEAHLHPQLQVLLADYLERTSVGSESERGVQTIVTSHSPTIAAHVGPTALTVVHRDAQARPRATALSSCGLAADEERRLARMLDITRASLLFSRGTILVEGVSEELLIPVLARRCMDVVLQDHAISVIPIGGVSFSTIAKLFSPETLSLPVAIVTDADPEIVYGEAERKPANALPKKEGGSIGMGARLKKLLDEFEGNACVEVFHSDVTLEYDLALAAETNPSVIYDAWESLYARGPRSLPRTIFDELAGLEERTLALWRAICVGDPKHGKADLAHALADRLEAKDEAGGYLVADGTFALPDYLHRAIQHVLPDDGP